MLNGIITQTYFGSTILQYLYFLVIVLGTIVLSKVVYYIITTIIKKFTDKTETRLDDLIMEALEKPFIIIILIFGIQLGLTFLTLPVEYGPTIWAITNIAITFVIAWVIIGLFNSFFDNYIDRLTAQTESKLDDQIAPIVKKGITFIILTLTLITVLSNFGYDVAALIGGLGIAGIAIAMAAQSTISDMLGGLSIFTVRPFEIDDAVNIEGTTGTVSEVGVRHSKIVTFDGTVLTVPNSKIASSIIENYTKSEKRRVKFNVGVTYDTSITKIKKAKQIIKDIVNEVEGTEKNTCAVRLMEFGDFSVNLTVIYYIKDKSKLFDIKDEVNMLIKEQLDKAKIDMAFPTQTIYLEK